METAAADHVAIFGTHLRQCPGVTVYLAKLCDRCDQRGELSGTVKLGDASMPVSELRTLRIFFGAALKNSAKHEHRLDLTSFLDTVPQPEAWIAALYAAAGRQRRNVGAEAMRIQMLWRQSVDRFQLAFPELTPIHTFLKDQEERRCRHLTEPALCELRACWFRLGEAVRFLQKNRRPVGLSDLGAQFFNDSKILRSGPQKSELCRWLSILSAEGTADETDSAELLARYGVTDNPTSIKVTFFGKLRYRKKGRWFEWPCELCKIGESATLSLDNLADIEAAEFVDAPVVVTCENETPFNNLIRDAFALPVIYTAGFPNTAVLSLLERLPAGTELKHWGDSDRHGLQIACILARSHPLSLWRCGVAELQRHGDALKPVSAAEKAEIQRLLAQNPTHPFAQELAFTADHGWLEQESWHESGSV